MRQMLFLFALVVLVGCGMQLRAPTPTPVNLESLIIQSGDLPAGLTAAQVLDTRPPAYDQIGMPQASKIIFQRLARGDAPGGFVVVSLYDNPANAYDTLAKSLGMVGVVTRPTGIGEAAIISADKALGTTLAVKQCRAVVEVLFTQEDAQSVTAYATRLLSRLQPVICAP